MLRQLPNAITLLNLLAGAAACGVLLLLMAFNNGMGLGRAYEWVAVLVAVGLAADFLDGLVARLLRAHSAVGKQLDSLADLVTFGLVPMLLVQAELASRFLYQDIQVTLAAAAGACTLIYAGAAGLRLARFSANEMPADYFVGLPVPAAAIGVMALLPYAPPSLGNWGSYWGAGLCLVAAVLMLVPVPLLALKFKGRFRWQRHWPQVGFVLSSVAVAIAWPGWPYAIPVLYFLYSYADWRNRKHIWRAGPPHEHHTTPKA